MTQLSQIMWLLHSRETCVCVCVCVLQVAAFTRNQFNYDCTLSHSSHRDYNQLLNQRSPPPEHILLDNDNTLDQFHTSDSEELPVISTRPSSTFTYTYNTHIHACNPKQTLLRSQLGGGPPTQGAAAAAPPEAAPFIAAEVA